MREWEKSGQAQREQSNLKTLLHRTIEQDGWEPACLKEVGEIEVPSFEAVLEGVRKAEPSAGGGFPERGPEKKPFFSGKLLFPMAAALLFCLLIGGAVLLLPNGGEAEAHKQGVEDLMEGEQQGLQVVTAQNFKTEMWVSEYLIESESILGEGKEILPELYVPGYIPEGYGFKSLYIKLSDNGSHSEYTYQAQEGELLYIKQKQGKLAAGSVVVQDVMKGEDLKGGTAYFAVDPKWNINSYQLYLADGTVLHVSGKLEQGELKEILEKLEQ